LYPLLVAFCGEFSISLMVSGHCNQHVREHYVYFRDPGWVRSSETLSTYQKTAYAAALTGARL
jgi:hypothetical protein